VESSSAGVDEQVVRRPPDAAGRLRYLERHVTAAISKSCPRAAVAARGLKINLRFKGDGEVRGGLA
jgi:hypothetical protein